MVNVALDGLGGCVDGVYMASFRGLMTFAKPVRATSPVSGAIPTVDDGTGYYATAPVDVNNVSPQRALVSVNPPL